MVSNILLVSNRGGFLSGDTIFLFLFFIFLRENEHKFGFRFFHHETPNLWNLLGLSWEMLNILELQ